MLDAFPKKRVWRKLLSRHTLTLTHTHTHTHTHTLSPSLPLVPLSHMFVSLFPLSTRSLLLNQTGFISQTPSHASSHRVIGTHSHTHTHTHTHTLLSDTQYHFTF